MKSTAKTVTEYLDSLPEPRAQALKEVQKIILHNLPAGYQEGILFSMMAYYIPAERYPATYNCQPPSIAALASQKNYMSLYLMPLYLDDKIATWFKQELQKRGKKLDMGKSCIRFKNIEDLPLDLIGEAIAQVSAEKLIELYEKSRR